MYGIDWITPRVLNLNFPETEIDTTHTIAKPVYILGKHTEIRRHPQNGDLKTWGKTDTGENQRRDMRDIRKSNGNVPGLRPQGTEYHRTPSDWYLITKGMKLRLTTEAEIPALHHRLEWNGDRLIELEKQGRVVAL